jgi:hypothetical protein
MGMTHERLMTGDEVEAGVKTATDQSLVIRASSFVIRHSSFVIRHSSFP